MSAFLKAANWNYPRSAALATQAGAVVPGGGSRTNLLMQPHRLFARNGTGAWITDVDGVQRLDCINNATALLHGHSFPPIQEAVSRQLRCGISFGLSHESELSLARHLVSQVPGFDLIRFTNSGTEAVMMAVRVARAYTGRPIILKAHGCYHGSYDDAAYGTKWPPHLAEPAKRMDAALWGRAQQAVDLFGFNDIDSLAEKIALYGDALAAIIVDPAPAGSGLVPISPEMVAALSRIRVQVGCLVISEEVMAFRLSVQGAHSLYGLTPDLVTLGKIIGGGFPVGAIAGRRPIMEIFDGTDKESIGIPHNGTFNANPMTMVAGLASLQHWTPAAAKRINDLTAWLQEEVTARFIQEELPWQIRVAGSLFKVLPECPDDTAVFHRRLCANNVLISPTLFGCLSTAMSDSDVELLSAKIVAAAAGVDCQ